MALKLSVGVSRKVGQPDYGSVGASCQLELEVDAGLLERDLDGFHARVRDAYVAAHRAVHDELARLHAPARPSEAPPAPPASSETNGRRNGDGEADRTSAGRSRPRRPATDNQVRAIRSIAARQHADLDGLLRDHGVGRPEDLSLRQASELIDVLKTAASI